MNYLKISLILSLILLSACSTQQIKTNSTAFYAEGYIASGKIFVVASSQEKNNSLEFANYKNKFEKKLSTAGYTPVNNKNDAEYIAVIDYGINEGQTSISSSPVYATGSYHFGRSFGVGASRVIGSSIDKITVYSRLITLDIMKASSLESDAFIENNKLYESRVKSLGTCADIAGVFDPLLSAMFDNFPGANGQTITTTAHYQGQCDNEY